MVFMGDARFRMQTASFARRGVVNVPEVLFSSWAVLQDSVHGVTKPNAVMNATHAGQRRVATGYSAVTRQMAPESSSMIT